MQDSDKPVCLLFGASGHVGIELRRLLAQDFSLHAPDRGQCDFSNPGMIRNVIQACKPSLIVNACAYTAVDAAEHESNRAYAVNAHALEVIAQEARKIHAAVVHYSTVFVFSGEAVVPYSETDSTDPINVYGKSKLLGEQLLFDTLGNDYPCWVLRPSWSYSAHARGNNFLKSILDKARAADSISVVSDEIGVPIPAALIADVTMRLLKVRPQAGVYHASCSGQTNRYEYAKFVIEQARKFGWPVRIADDQIMPISSEHFNAPAARPKYILMDCSKLENALSMRLPDWHQGIEMTIKNIAEKHKAMERNVFIVDFPLGRIGGAS